MAERLRFMARLLNGESMSEVCREFGISRKTGYKIYTRYKDRGLEALTDRSRRPVRYATSCRPRSKIRSSRLSRRSRIGARARFANSWCGAWPAIFASPPRAPFTPSCTGTDWSKASPGRDHVPTARRCHQASIPTSFGAPTSRVNSSLATANTVTRSPSLTTPRVIYCYARPWIRSGRTPPSPPSSSSLSSVACQPPFAPTTACRSSAPMPCSHLQAVRVVAAPGDRHRTNPSFPTPFRSALIHSQV